MRGALPLLIVLGALVPATARALPVDQSAEGTDDDARIIVSLPSKVIADDVRSRCAVRIIVGSEDVPFSHRDTVTLRIIEDDPIGNDEVFSETLEVSPLEVGAGSLDRTIDCTTAFGDDGGDHIELFATALIEKDDCGIGCRQDRPTTEVLNVEIVTDQLGEELDDQAAGATEIGEGDVGGLVAADQDWFVFRATGGVRTRVDVLHRPRGGALVAWIQGDAGVVENRMTPTLEGARLEADLSDGIWFLVVSPERDEDPNFYDLRLTALAPEAQCDPGETATEACGACGTVERTCDEDGQWPPIQEGECQGQGECRPGETLQATCERCGRRTDTCGDDCAWAAGVCEGGGECDPGTWNTEDCADGGVQSRVCRDTCLWSAFGPCRTADDPGGACVPSSEDCADGVDNDCDGKADGEDLDCAAEQPGGWRLGLSDPCTTTADCDPDPAKALECIGPPAYPVFEGGYCAQVGCLFPDVCQGAGGVCAVAFGQVWCLRPCVIQSDCLIGHHCADLGESAAADPTDPADANRRLKACVPVCRGHADCAAGPKNFCSPRSGRCELPPDTLPGGTPPTQTGGGGGDGGCLSAIGSVVDPAPTWSWPLRR